MGTLEEILSAKGICLSYADEIKMPGNYIVGHPSPVPSKVRKVIEAAAVKVHKAALAIANRERKPVKRKAYDDWYSGRYSDKMKEFKYP